MFWILLRSGMNKLQRLHSILDTSTFRRRWHFTDSKESQNHNYFDCRSRIYSKYNFQVQQSELAIRECASGLTEHRSFNCEKEDLTPFLKCYKTGQSSYKLNEIKQNEPAFKRDGLTQS